MIIELGHGDRLGSPRGHHLRLSFTLAELHLEYQVVATARRCSVTVLGALPYSAVMHIKGWWWMALPAFWSRSGISLSLLGLEPGNCQISTISWPESYLQFSSVN